MNVQMIEIINPATGKKLRKEGNAYVDADGNQFPIVRGAVRMVGEGNYTDSFGYQWNKFEKTQIDKDQNITLSKERFFAESQWDKEDLTGKNVLEVGSGAGRFSQIVLDYTKANLYSVDYSDAVSANFRNNGHHGDRFNLFQASIYEMPFPDNSFDKVFCFGVLQHTPDFKQSVKCLIDKCKSGGEVVVDFYPIYGWWTKLHSKYILRPFTKKMSHDKLLNKIESNADRLINAYNFLDRIGLRPLTRFLPVVDIKGTLPANLSKEELREWVILDTFDMFSPEHDHPQRICTVAKWFREFGMEVTLADSIPIGSGFRAAVVRGIKK